MTTHQRQFFAQGEQLDGESSHIGFFDDNAPAGLERSPELIHGFLLVANVMQGIYHDDTIRPVPPPASSKASEAGSLASAHSSCESSGRVTVL